MTDKQRALLQWLAGRYGGYAPVDDVAELWPHATRTMRSCIRRGWAKLDGSGLYVFISDAGRRALGAPARR